jgi:RNA polymerase sigma-70 factor (ECF subfamily)
VGLVREDRLTEQFAASRPRLLAIAIRMLGTADEAEDAVQEAWLHFDRRDATGVENLAGWLTTVLARVCLDRLRSRSARREDLGGIDLASAVVDDRPGPEEQAVLADSVGAAMLVVLDLLSPSERVAFVLHDVFAVPFDQVGTVIGRAPEAARQLASRARRRVQGSSAAADLDVVRKREVVAAFLAAAQRGDFAALVALLDPDVVLRPDAGALRLGALRETRGARAVAAALSGGLRGGKLALIAGDIGVAWIPGGRLRGAVEVRMVDGCIAELRLTGSTGRLRELDIVILEDCPGWA